MTRRCYYSTNIIFQGNFTFHELLLFDMPLMANYKKLQKCNSRQPKLNVGLHQAQPVQPPELHNI
jgi:hypothetical protein